MLMNYKEEFYMTDKEWYNLMEKYNLDLDGNLVISCMDFAIGELFTSANNLGIRFYDITPVCTLYNPIAVEYKMKNLVLKIKEKLVQMKLNRIENDF